MFQINHSNSFIPYFNSTLDWELVAAKKECSGKETGMGRVVSSDVCASRCHGKSSMFALGTNDYFNNRCNERGCTCLCETAAKSDGTCNMIDDTGYRLYKFVSKRASKGGDSENN